MALICHYAHARRTCRARVTAFVAIVKRGAGARGSGARMVKRARAQPMLCKGDEAQAQWRARGGEPQRRRVADGVGKLRELLGGIAP